MMLMTVLIGPSDWRRLCAALLEPIIEAFLPPTAARLARARQRARRYPPATAAPMHHHAGIALVVQGARGSRWGSGLQRGRGPQTGRRTSTAAQPTIY